MTALGAKMAIMEHFLLILGSLQTLLDKLGITLQEFITNSYFVQKIKFKLLLSFLTFIFVWKKV